MSSTIKSASSSSASSSASSRSAPEHMIALPSLSNSLSSLPQATSVDNIALHPSMSTQRAAESEAKLRKALQKSAASHGGVPAAYMPPSLPQQQYSPSGNSPPLMMRKPTKKITV